MNCVSYSLLPRSRAPLGFCLRAMSLGCGAYVDSVEPAFKSSEHVLEWSECEIYSIPTDSALSVEIGDMLMSVGSERVADQPFDVVVSRIRAGRKALKRGGAGATELILHFTRYVPVTSPGLGHLMSLTLYDVTMDPTRLPWYLDFVYSHFSGHDQLYSDDYEIAKALLWVEVCQLLHDYDAYTRCLCSWRGGGGNPVAGGAVAGRSAEHFKLRSLVALKKLFSPNSISNTNTSATPPRTPHSPNSAAALFGAPVPEALLARPKKAPNRTRAGVRDKKRHSRADVSTFSLFHLLPFELQQQLMNQLVITTVNTSGDVVHDGGDLTVDLDPDCDPDAAPGRVEQTEDRNRLFSFVHQGELAPAEQAGFTAAQLAMFADLREWLHEELAMRSFELFRQGSCAGEGPSGAFSEAWRRMEAHLSLGGVDGTLSSELSVMPLYHSRVTFHDLLNDSCNFVRRSSVPVDIGSEYEVATGDGLIFAHFHLFTMEAYRGAKRWILLGVLCLKWIWRYFDCGSAVVDSGSHGGSFSALRNMLGALQRLAQRNQGPNPFVGPLLSELSSAMASLETSDGSSGPALLRIQSALTEVLEIHCQITSSFLASRVCRDMHRSMEVGSEGGAWVLRFRPDTGAKLLERVACATSKWTVRSQQEQAALLRELAPTGAPELPSLPRSRSVSVCSTDTSSSSASMVLSDGGYNKLSLATPARPTAVTPTARLVGTDAEPTESYVLPDWVSLHRYCDVRSPAGKIDCCNGESCAETETAWAVLFDVVQGSTELNADPTRSFRVRHVVPLPTDGGAVKVSPGAHTWVWAHRCVLLNHLHGFFFDVYDRSVLAQAFEGMLAEASRPGATGLCGALLTSVHTELTVSASRVKAASARWSNSTPAACPSCVPVRDIGAFKPYHVDLLGSVQMWVVGPDEQEWLRDPARTVTVCPPHVFIPAPHLDLPMLDEVRVPTPALPVECDIILSAPPEEPLTGVAVTTHEEQTPNSCKTADTEDGQLRLAGGWEDRINAGRSGSSAADAESPFSTSPLPTKPKVEPYLPRLVVHAAAAPAKPKKPSLKKRLASALGLSFTKKILEVTEEEAASLPETDDRNGESSDAKASASVAAVVSVAVLELLEAGRAGTTATALDKDRPPTVTVTVTEATTEEADALTCPVTARRSPSPEPAETEQHARSMGVDVGCGTDTAPAVEPAAHPLFEQLISLPLSHPHSPDSSAPNMETVIGSGIGLFFTNADRLALSREQLVQFQLTLRPDAGTTADKSPSHLPVMFKLLHQPVNATGREQLADMLATALCPSTEVLDATQTSRTAAANVLSVFEAISMKHVAWLFLAFLLEQKVVIVSSKLSAITALCEWLKRVIRPLSFCPTYAPTVCSSVSAQMVECPTPFCLGWFVSAPHGDCGLAARAAVDSIQANSDSSTGEEVLLLDVDNDYCVSPVCMAGFLASVTDPLVRRARLALLNRYYSADSAAHRSVNVGAEFEAVSAVYEEFTAELLTGVDECVVSRIRTAPPSVGARGCDAGAVNEGDAVALLDEQLFRLIKAESKSPSVLADGEFISMFCRTQALSEYVCARSVAVGPSGNGQAGGTANE